MNIRKFLMKHGSLMLTVGASVGVVATSVLSGKAVLEADKILNDISDKDLKTANTQKRILSVYIPPVLSGVATIACIIGCHLMNKKIQAGLIAAYGVIDTTFKAYKSKLSAEEQAQIQKEIDKDCVIENLEELLNNRPGEEYELWIDDYRKRPYWARKSDILLGKDEINRSLNSANYSRHYGTASLGEFYSHVKGESEPQDYIFGWNIDYMLEEWDEDNVEVNWFESDIYTNPETGKQISCNRICWSIDPISNYWNYESSWSKIESKDDSREK